MKIPFHIRNQEVLDPTIYHFPIKAKNIPKKPQYIYHFQNCNLHIFLLDYNFRCSFDDLQMGQERLRCEDGGRFVLRNWRLYD